MPPVPVPVTYLFVPGDRPDRFAKALASGADRIILDLEDAVRPEGKPAARQAVAAAEIDWTRVAIRVNPASSPFWADDLRTVAATRAAALMVPKAERADDLAAASAAAGRAIEILPQIETAVGLDRIEALLAAPGVTRLAFGHLDFALDIGSSNAPEALGLARQMLVFRSRVAGRAAPVDSVTAELDEGTTRRDAEAARALGFGGKLLIHPSQVAPVAEAFAPGADEIAWARRIVEAAERGARGAVALDGRMIDKPVEDAARRILARARTP
jgi:citrate lyase subunit beta/citryl-CoA lyase